MEEDYTRERFIGLLEKHFCKVENEGGRFQLKNLHNIEVADVLDFDDTQFGKFLNPSPKKTDSASFYRMVIGRLIKHEEIKNLKQQVEDLVTENKNLRLEAGKLAVGKKEVQAHSDAYKHRSYLFGTLFLVTTGISVLWFYLSPEIPILGYVIAVLFAVVVIAMGLSILQNPWFLEKIGRVKHTDSDSNSYLVRDSGTLENIMQWHGKMIRYQLALEGIILNAKVKEIETELTPQQQQSFIEEAKEIIKKVVREERVGLASLHFSTLQGANLATILNEAAPHDSLFSDSDSLFSAGFKNIAPYLLSKKASVKIIADESVKEVTTVQHNLWNKMIGIIFPK